MSLLSRPDIILTKIVFVRLTYDTSENPREFCANYWSEEAQLLAKVSQVTNYPVYSDLLSFPSSQASDTHCCTVLTLSLIRSIKYE